MHTPTPCPTDQTLMNGTPVMRPAAQRTLLEVNARPARDLEHLLEAIGQIAVERELNVHRTTVQRWQRGLIRIPGAKHQAIKMLLGDLPGTDGQWSGWLFHGGRLWSPGKDSFAAGDVLSLIFLRQEIAALKADIRKLKV